MSNHFDIDSNESKGTKDDPCFRGHSLPTNFHALVMFPSFTPL